MPTITRSHPSRLVLLLTLLRRAVTRPGTALILRDADGWWMGPPIAARTVLTRRSRVVYEVELRQQPLILGVRIDGATPSTAHVLVSSWVEDPIRVVSAGAAATRERLHESIVTAVRSMVAGDTAAGRADRGGFVASVGGVCWELHRLHIGPEVSDAGGAPCTPDTATAPQNRTEQRRFGRTYR